MKNLLLIASAMLSASAFAAEWEKPVYTGSFQPISSDSVYLFNTGSKLFLTEGNDWGTHASVGIEGREMCVYQHTVDTEWDGKTYTMQFDSKTKNGWHNVFITDGGGVYVDAGATATDIYFSFIDLGNNQYKIVGAEINPTWHATGDYATYEIGHSINYINNKDNIQTGTGVVFDDNGEDTYYEAGEFLTTWAFVSKSDYAEYYKKVEAYNAAGNLKALMDKAAGLGIDISEAQAAYDNTSNSAETINAAINTLDAKINSFYEVSVTPETPIDFTSLISNAECSAVDGWTNGINATTWNTQTWIDESWQGFEGTTLNIWGAALNGKVSQKLTGLPNGIYIVSAAIYSEKIDGYVFANENRKDVPGTAAGNKYSVTTEVTDGTLEVGYGQDTEGTNWVAMDNVSVHYYGSGVEAYRYWINGLIESSPKFDDSDIIVQGALLEEYKNVLASVSKVQTKEEILGIIPSSEEILNKINANANAYASLVLAKTNSSDITGNDLINDYYADLIYEYINDVVDQVVEEHNLGTAEVENVKDSLQSLIDEAQNFIWNNEKFANELANAEEVFAEYGAACSLEASEAYTKFKAQYTEYDNSELTNEGLLALINQLYDIEFNLKVPAEPASDANPVDYTAKVSFPSFDNGAEGWINDGFTTCGLNDWNSFADGEIIDKQYLNLWNEKAARVYQTITGLPNGAYQVQISAFADAAGFQVYANDNFKDVKVGQNENGDPCYYGNIYTIDVIVSDGTLEIGGRIAENTTVWAMLDRCSLTYFGTESEIITGICTPDVKTDNEKVIGTFSMGGMKTNGIQKGISIVKMANGNTKKIMTK